MKSITHKLFLGVLLLAMLMTLLTLFAIPQAKSAALYYLNTSKIGKTATSSSDYIIGGSATTTDTFVSDGYEQVSYMVSVASSTTPPTLCWTTQYSNDSVFWYGDDPTVSTTTGQTLVGSAGKEYCWVYATTTVNSLASLTAGADGKEIYLFKKINIGRLDTVYTRVKFYVLSGTNARVGVERNLKNEVIIQK